MTYAEAEHFLFHDLTSYLRTGKLTAEAAEVQDESTASAGGAADGRAARKFLPSRSKVLQMLHHLGNPHARPGQRYLHVAGTNGKGTVSHLLAALCRHAGSQRTGLYTSPHYVSYRERIRVNGEMIPEAAVATFVKTYRDVMLELRLSFFEATAALAFWHFAREHVDVAVLEVGMGGTWDATNVIVPAVAVITNIGLDHQRELGDTLAQIAGEKAGIMRHAVPTVVGRRQPETTPVFEALAAGLRSPIHFAELAATPFQEVESLTGPFVHENLQTALCAYRVYETATGLEPATDATLRAAIAQLPTTGYVGRFATVASSPEVIVDAGHNPDAWRVTLARVRDVAAGRQLGVLCGFKDGKDATAFFDGLPRRAVVVVSQSAVLGASPRDVLAQPGVAAAVERLDLRVSLVADLRRAYRSLAEAVGVAGLVFVGGSSYVVGDVLRLRPYGDAQEV